MRFCPQHWHNLRAEIADRDITPENASALVQQHVAFDRVGDGECPVCVSVRMVEERWVASAALAIVSRTERRES